MLQVYLYRCTYSIFSKIRNKTRIPTFTIFVQHSFGSLSHISQRRKRKKNNQNWKGTSKTVTVRRWHDTIQRKSYRYHRKLLELINEFSKVVGYKINIQKLVAFLYTNNELSERKNKEKIPFTITSKRINYLAINPPKELKGQYLENYKTMMKERQQKQLERHSRFWIGRINIRITMLSKAIYSLNTLLKMLLTNTCDFN